MSEVLRVLHDGDAGHPDDDRIRTRVQGARGDNPVVDVMKGAGRVFLTADHGYGTCDETRGGDWSAGLTPTATRILKVGNTEVSSGAPAKSFHCTRVLGSVGFNFWKLIPGVFQRF